MDCSLPGSSVHGIFQTRVLEWGAIAFSRREGRCVQCLLHKDGNRGSRIGWHELRLEKKLGKWSRP